MKRQEFEEAALPHLNDLYRTATRLLADSTKADDLVQDVYLQAWKSFDRFEVGTNCRAWLYKILFHVVHHHRRKWFNVRMVKESEEILDQVAAPPEPIPEKLTDEEILSALDGVPQDFRAVVMLVDVDEFSYKEASVILNVPIGTVMSRLSRGRKLLLQLEEIAQSYGIGKGKLEGQTA